MRIIRSRHFPRGNFHALNLCGTCIVNTRHGELTATEVRHEQIHTLQQWEMTYVGFYLWYAVEWFVRLAQCRFNADRAYWRISLEREAYAQERNTDYLRERRPFAWLKYLHTPA
jgi:hypothetical protein